MNREVRGNWATVTLGAFPPGFLDKAMLRSQGSNSFYAFDVSPSTPGHLFASNSRAIIRSEDDGCTWTNVFALVDIPEFSMDSCCQIMDVVVAPKARAEDEDYRVFVVVSNAFAPITYIYVSEDSGRTFARKSQINSAGADRLSDVLWVAPSDPDVAYLSLNEHYMWGTAKHISPSVYRTADGGATWANVLSGLERATQMPLGDTEVYKKMQTNFSFRIEIDPVDPNSMWIWGSYADWNENRVFRSSDGGASFTPVTTDPMSGANVTDILIEHRIGGPTRVTLTGSQAVEGQSYPSVMTSTDDGASWTELAAPPVESGLDVGGLLAPGPKTGRLMWTNKSTAFRYEARGDRWVRLNDQDLSRYEIEVLPGRKPTYYFPFQSGIASYKGKV